MKELTPDEILAAIQRAMEETWRRIDQAKAEKSESRETGRRDGSALGAGSTPVAREP